MASTAPKCAVVFGIPVTREEFENAAKADSGSDYLTGMVRGMDAVGVWTSDYQKIARAAQQLINTAGNLGAGIYQAATIADFADATDHFQYVVLFAHWRGAIYRANDFTADVAEILDRIDQSPFLKALEPARLDQDALVDVLNEAIMDMKLLDILPKRIGDAGKRTRAVGQALCRDLLDEVLAGLVAPGNRVELFDGLHAPYEVESALATEFAGQLDLALCNSEALATFIDLRRHNLVHHLHWPDLVNPLPQLLKVEKTLQLMSTEGGDYIDTRLRVEEAELKSSEE